MKLNIKNLFLFGTIYSSVYIFLLSLLSINNKIVNNSNFNFLNLNQDLQIIESFYGGTNSYVFGFYTYTLNLTFILYFISYISLLPYFIIQFFLNIALLIIYEITAIQYPISLLPLGIGNFLSNLFYIIIIIVIITGIKIVSSGLNSGD